MTLRLAPRSGYSAAENLSDAVVHVAGLAAAILAVPVLITLAVVWHGDLSAVAAATIYGLCLVGMILCSALYNMAPAGTWKNVLRRLDHSAIYFKIAGTYTPFSLLSGGHALVVVLWLWGAALMGTGMRVFAPQSTKPYAIALYLVMGWGGAFAASSMFSELPGPVLTLVVIGGLIYTSGFVFYVFKRLPFHRTIWHVFVLAASVTFFAAVSMHLAATRLPALG
ncbi:PAQR family membrane homeostasis protein TrhA [Tranquillimonas alkanivorans]|uniref:Hemolysin III n=1 Tax=Tranquillimonas alkanivorans TaxID=441119 RepID=A0A1I5QQN1_9RHOB|nr:hemolysin III family protein [Tranquillimonas alkanivorans]SFP48341.1 hemolysin III [Tranquillimonas alkanivorans]